MYYWEKPKARWVGAAIEPTLEKLWGNRFALPVLYSNEVHELADGNLPKIEEHASFLFAYAVGDAVAYPRAVKEVSRAGISSRELWTRRGFLARAGEMAAILTSGGIVAPRYAFALQQSSKDRLIIRSPNPQDLETPTHLLTSWLTPNDLFYVRSHFYTPSISPNDWRLVVEGEVDTPLQLALRDLLKFENIAQVVTLECAGNGRAFFDPPVAGVQWEKGAVGTANWEGVRLADVLRAAGLRSSARYIWLDGADRGIGRAPDFIRSLPLEKALDAATLLAFRMNAEPLPGPHGFPLRAVVPGWEGAYSTKWLTHIRVSTEDHDGPFVQSSYRRPARPVIPGTLVPAADTVPVTELPIKSMITSLAPGALMPQSPVRVAGFAWVGDADVERVDVSTDGGRTWIAARLGDDRAPYAWREFAHTWTPPHPGAFVLLSRATDTRGRTQPIVPDWNPSGYLWNAVDQVRINIGPPA